MISILIPTKNEEQDLPGCLESVRWSDDIHVDDSCSTDATATVASGAGAKLFVRPQGSGTELFNGNEAEHKNWSLTNLQFKYDWVLHLDADERVTPELRASIEAAVRNPGDKVAFRIRRRDFWGDRWLKHAQLSSYYLRLFRPDKMRYERLINPVPIPDGQVGELTGYLDHYPFSKGVTAWWTRHNHYSSFEARQILRNRSVNQHFDLSKVFFGKDHTQRRFHQKELFYRMPLRPLIKFLFLYVGKRGVLDGAAGFRYAMLQAFYEYMIVLKTRELSEKTLVPAALRHPASQPTTASFENLHASPRTND